MHDDSQNNFSKKILNCARRAIAWLPSFLVRKYRNFDYLHYWVSDQGKRYRDDVFERQKATGWKQLVTNPSFDEIRSALDLYSPIKVLEVGCGWGRILEVLNDHYDIEGCDIAEDYLKLVPKNLKVFKLDVVHPTSDFMQKHKAEWDVIFCRGVMLYFLQNKHTMKAAMETMEALAAKKIIIWEWSHVCEQMKGLFPCDKFDYRPLAKLEE